MKLHQRVLHWLDRWWENRKIRYDRHPAYVFEMVALFCVSTSLIIIGPVPGSVVSELSPNLQDSLSLCIWVGSGYCLYGITSGSRRFRPNAGPRICYQINMGGLPAVAIGTGTYGWAVITGTESWISAAGGVLLPMIAAGNSLFALFLWLEVRRITRGVTAIIHTREATDEQ